MISHGFNYYILALYEKIPLSNLLLRRQLSLYGKVARLPSTCSMRSLVFEKNSFKIAEKNERKRGRPRQEWASELEKYVCKMLPNELEKEQCLLNKREWTRKVWQFTELFKTSD